MSAILPKRILVIGLDGATFDVLRPLMEADCLPNLSSLLEQGSHAPLLSTIPPLTAPAWSTFATGVNPGKHGVFEFFQTSRDGSRAVVTSGSLRCPTLWDYLGQAGKRVGLVNVPMTYPPQAIRGFVVSGIPAPLQPRVFTSPPELAERLPGYRIDLPYFLGGREFQAEYVPAAKRLLKDLRELMEVRGEYALKLMREERWDLFMVVFTETDRVGHYLWPSLEEVVHEAKQGPRSELALWFSALDEVIGRLVQEAGPDTGILVVSDHGMGPAASRRFFLNDWLLQRGFLSLRGRAWTNPNTWLWKLGISRDAAARLAGRLPRTGLGMLRARVGRTDVPVDHQKSRAYMQPIYEFIAGIRLVEGALPEAACPELLEEIGAALQGATDPGTGKPIVDKVYRRDEIYHGPHASASPHLIAMLDCDFVANHRVGNKALVADRQEIQTKVFVTGAHRFEGVFVAKGPGIRRRRSPHFAFRLQDIAPSVLYLLGLPVPDHMDGRVLLEIMDESVTRRKPIQYANGVLTASSTGRPGLSAREEAEVRRQLEGLGYLG